MASHTATLSRRTKVLYGVGDIGFSLTSTLIGVYLLLFLTDVVGLRPALAGLAILIGKQWDWVNDPLVGHLSDRTRSRWGRRRPFLLFGFVPFGLVFALLWWRPPIEGQIALAVYYAFMYVLYDTVATFVYMPYFALTPELTSDYDERTALTTYRMAFSILGSLVAFTVPWLIIGSFRPENADAVFRNGVLFAALSAVPLLLTFVGTTERPGLQAAPRPDLRASLRAAAQNRPFTMAAALYLLTWLTVSIVQGVLLYFIKYWLGMEGQSDALFAVIFVTALLMLPLWQWAARRKDKRLAYAYGIGWWAAVQLVLVLVAPGTPAAVIYALGVALPVGIVTVGLRRITQPVAALTDAARRIAQGEFGRVVEIPTEDELHELATAFNRMSTELADLYDKLERKLADRTRQLATLNAIASMASRSQEVAEVLQGALDRTLEGIDTCAGLAFACRRHPPELTLTGYRGVSPELVAAAGRCTTRSGPCPTCDPSVARYRPSVWGNWEPFWRARDGSTRSSCP